MLTAHTQADPQVRYSTERLTSPDVERIWANSERYVEDLLNDAKEGIDNRGETFSTKLMVADAYALQTDYLENANTEEWEQSRLVANRIALLMLAVPSAVHAQHELDKAHKANREDDPEKFAHVATLSQFNKDLGGILAHADDDLMLQFADRFVAESAKLYVDKLGLPSFNRREFYNIMSGSIREVAVWRALTYHAPDLELEQSTVDQDVLGTDLTVTDGDVRLAIDIKSNGSFEQKIRKFYGNNLSDFEYNSILNTGYFFSNGEVQDQQAGRVCIMDADHFGHIKHAKYDDPSQLIKFIHDRLAEKRYEKTRSNGLRQVGKSAITTKA